MDLTSRKRPSLQAFDPREAVPLRPEPKRRREARALEGRDVLTVLPAEILTPILRIALQTPVDNVRLQRVNRRFCAVLRDDLFWRAISPEVPQAEPEAGGSSVSESYAPQAKSAARDTLYWQFQQRTALGPQGYDRGLQRLLVQYWKSTITLTFPPMAQAKYDLARSAVPHANFAEAYAPFGNDRPMMQALSSLGSRMMYVLHPRLRADAAFMKLAVEAHTTNYSLACADLQHDDAFNMAILKQRGHALALMPPRMRASKDAVLTALGSWDRALSDYMGWFGPFYGLSEQLRNDPEVVYACARLCPNTILLAMRQAPERRWDEDRTLVNLSLEPSLYVRPYFWASPVTVFFRVHASLRDDAQIALKAVALSSGNAAAVSQRLRNDVNWCLRAIAVKPSVLYYLPGDTRRNWALSANMKPADQLTCLAALRSTVGSNRRLLMRLLAHPEIRQSRQFNGMLTALLSVYRRISPNLKRDAHVLRAILDYDGREFGLFDADLQDNMGMRLYAADALLKQLRLQHDVHSLRDNPAFSWRQPSLRGHSVLGVFARDLYFARRFLQVWPDLGYLFAHELRTRGDLVALARLGTLLQEDAGIYSTLGGRTNPTRQLMANLRLMPDDFALNLALGAFFMVRQNWQRAEPWLARALTLARTQSAPTQAARSDYLLTHMPKQAPTRELMWYRELMALVNSCYVQVAQEKSCRAALSTAVRVV